jgi:hypothetical protein
VPRTRTTKKLAQRIDLNYFKRPNPLRRALFFLSLAGSVLAVLWLGWHAIARDNRLFSAGRLSPAHAVLTKECTACHVAQAGAFREPVGNHTCLACHDGPIHHANQLFTPDCATCHAEHREAVRLSATSDADCAQCHGNLKSRAGQPNYVRSITSFTGAHPEFAVLREKRRNPDTIKLNHAVHLRPNLPGPTSPVKLECGDCHRPPAANEPWRFGDAQFRTASPAANSGPLAPQPTRRLMAPPKFAQACSACHLLQFDQRFPEGVPHDKPETVHAFVVKKFQEYIAAHPAEVRVVHPSEGEVAEKPITKSSRTPTPSQWVADRTAEAEQLLWRKTCKECHTLTFSEGVPLPKVTPANFAVRSMPHAKFDHDAHRGFACASCHAAAPASQETSDVLLPGIATCKTCHAPGKGHAESRCFECHTFHDWSQRKEVTPPSFMLPALRSSQAAAPIASGR